MLIKLTVEIDGKTKGLSIQIDEKEIVKDTNYNIDSIKKIAKSSIMKITDRILNSIEVYKEEEKDVQYEVNT